LLNAVSHSIEFNYFLRDARLAIALTVFGLGGFLPFRI
jgi:hypothetical protein